jgi:hypothetical protein
VVQIALQIVRVSNQIVSASNRQRFELSALLNSGQQFPAEVQILSNETIFSESRQCLVFGSVQDANACTVCTCADTEFYILF